MIKNELKKKVLKTLLLSIVSLTFISCSNLFDNGNTSSEQSEISGKQKTLTITGIIKLPEELTGSGAIPEEYKCLFDSMNTAEARTAFPLVPTGSYYVTATSGSQVISSENTTDPITITSPSTGATFSMTLPIDETETTWTIEAGFKANFNDSTVIILKDSDDVTISATTPTFSHDFHIKPLAIDANSKGNVSLIIDYETSGMADELELYFGSTKITADSTKGETLSPTLISLKNYTAGSYKAKLVFKKNHYVVFTDYQGINIFPNMTTSRWVNNGGTSPITASNEYRVRNSDIQDYLITQIYVGNTTVGGTTITASDTTGNGTVFAPFATFAKAIDYLQKNGDTSKAYTIWISGEISGAQTISDGTESSPTHVKASSLTISGVTGNTSDSLKGGSSGSVLTVDTAVPVTITNLKITGGKGTSTTITSTLTATGGGGINIKSGTVSLSTGAWITGNYAEYGGGVYVASGAKLFMSDNSVVGDLITNSTSTASSTTDCSNYATTYGGGIYVNGGELYLGYTNGTPPTLDSNFTGGVNRNFCPQGSNTSVSWGGGIYFKGSTFKMSNGTISYNYAYMDGGGLTISGENTNFYFSGGNISNNTARNQGGGIFLRDKANIFMSGTALIGDTGTDMTDSSKFSNKVTSDTGKGGGLYAEGAPKLYLGYTDASHTDNNFSGGICHNYSAKGGGGMQISTAEVYIAGGNINYNSAANSGGAIALSGTLTLTGGTFTSNTCGSDGNGGAIYYTGGTIKYSGSATFPSGTAKSNDIYLNSTSQKITIANTNLTGVASITPSTWTRGTQILDGGANITTTTISKFSITDSEWSIVKTGTGANTKGHIDAPLYVAGSSALNISGVSYGVGKTPANGGLGTKASPYSKIDDAVAQCWHGPNDTVTNTGRTITIVGTVGGGHTISSSITTSANATAITLAGVNTDATLNGGFSSGSSHEGRPLTITSAVPIIIQNLTIKGGYTTDGGGIYVSASGAKLTLTTGAKVTGNTVTNGSGGGGGIYIAGNSTSKANLIMNSTAQIYGNTGRNSTAEVKGGGAYLSYANLCMAGSAIIGAYQGTGTSAAQNSGGQYSNFAYKYGGGVYCDKNSSVWLGYSEAAANKTSTLTAGYGIVYNYASSDGGGLYCLGQIHMSSGSVSNNGCGGSYAGGIYLYTDANGTASMEMSGGALSYNVSTFYGGGIYVKGASSLSLSGTGTTLVSNIVTGSSGKGGAIYLNSTSSFNIKDCPSIASSAAKNNDVYLDKTISNNVATRAVVKINGALSGSGNIMNLTCGSWDRGIKLVTRTDGNKMDDTTMARFSTSQSGWQKMLSHDELSMVINQPIYVRGNNNVNICTGTASSTNSGTAASPLDSFESIKNLLTDTTAEYLVYLDGSLTTSQTLSSNFDGKAAALTIKGPSGYAGTNRDALYGSYTASSPGTMLIIGTTLPITLDNIQIHGGHGTSSNKGGGIRIGGCKANVTLKGLYIQDNHATNSNGAAICVGSSTDGCDYTVLNIIGCRVDWNILHQKTVTKYSGAGLMIENSRITLNIQGGDFQMNKTSYSGASGNPSTEGIGLFLGNKATTTLDGVTINYHEYTDLPEGKTATVLGGGIYMQGGTLTIKGNSVIENNTATKGGGLYIHDNMTPSVTLKSGSRIKDNTAELGSDVCTKGSNYFTNEGGTVGTNVAVDN